MNEQRRLAAILVADVVGYSKLIGSDEAGTLVQLRVLRTEVLEPQIAKHSGRLFKAVGDGFLVEFASAVQAVMAAQAIQEANANGSLQLRIGIHLGDVVVQGDDLMGDGVNVAARIEGVADPGSIALSRAVHEQVRDKLDVAFVDKGEVELKNIARPVQVFVVSGARTSAAPSALPLPDKPSIAVLPFQNMSGDPEQEYFTDGMVEEITTAISRLKWLTVIARNSASIYKGRMVDVRQVSRELGARYLLEGSVRKAAGLVRITGQLIDGESGAHLWADRFDGPLHDVFALHDRVAMAVAGAIEPALRDAETQRARRKPTESLDAYDLYMRALSEIKDPSRDGMLAAIGFARRASALDPRFAAVLGLHATALQMLVTSGWFGMEVQPEALRLARAAMDNASDDAEVLAEGANVFAYMLGEIEVSLSAVTRALELNPNSLMVLRHCGFVHLWAGQTDTAIGHFDRALRLGPKDPWRGYSELGLALGHWFIGRSDDALAYGRRAIISLPNNFACYRVVTASLVSLGRLEEAQDLVREALQRLPQGRIHTEHYMRLWRNTSQSKSYVAALRTAGMPD